MSRQAGVELLISRTPRGVAMVEQIARSAFRVSARTIQSVHVLTGVAGQTLLTGTAVRALDPQAFRLISRE